MLLQYVRLVGVVTAMFTFFSHEGLCGDGQQKAASFRQPIDGLAGDGTPQTTPEPSDDMPHPDCQNYNLKIGISNVQYYSCCGGLKNKTIEYEPLFENYHCYPTRLRYGILNVTSRFECNGVDGQLNAKRRCSERWGWVDESVDCWIWSECFAGACAQETIELGSSSNIEKSFCGDGRCDANSENTTNCALDCCQVDNPKCIAFNNTCPEACCAEATCCADADSQTAMVKTFWMIVLGVVAFLAILVVVICCCCCYCCYSKCCKKPARRYSHIERDVEMSKSQESRSQHRKK